MSDQETPWRVLRAAELEGRTMRPLFPDAAPKIMRRGVVEHVAQVEQALVDARAEADALLERARIEAEELRAQARAEGQRQGVEDVFSLLQDARREYDRVLQEAVLDMVELAFGIAARLVGRAVTVDDNILRDLVLQALEHARGRRQIVILAHPEDVPVLESHRVALERHVEGSRLLIDADASLERGDCILETESGRVDARLRVQLEVLRASMMG